MTVFIFGGFGLIIGSFLNVLILRWGKRGLGGRTSCMSCERTLSWYDMIPVFSWFALHGTCRTCNARISVQYPIVEALTAILFAVIGVSSLVLGAQVFSCAMAALLIAIAAYDLRHTIILDAWVFTFAALAFISQALFTPQGEFGILMLLSGPIVAAPLFALWLFSRGAWMGFGDVKLALGMGWLLGPLYGVAAVFFAFVIGATFSLPLLFLSSHMWRKIAARITPTLSSPKFALGFTIKSEIPFGPFLVASTLIIWLSLIYSVDPLALVGLLP